MATRARFVFWLLLLLLVIVANGCGGAYGGGAAESAAPMGGALMGDAAYASPTATPGEKDEKSGGADATTWKRSQLGAHTIRVKIGDRDELPVRSMQAKVTVDGFMARVVLDVQVKNDRSSMYEG